MWFKNLQIYRFTKAFELTPEALAERLSEYAFQPCGSQDISRYGWVSPLGHLGSELVHAANGYIMICGKKQDKLLPAAVINEQVAEKIIAIQASEGRAVGRKEKQALKEQLTFELLPRALCRSNLQFAYIAPQQGLLVVDAASGKRAEELLVLLRETIGSVPVIPLTANNIPQQIMTHWLQSGQSPKGFALGHECELRDPSDEGAVVRCKHQQLTSEEMISHIKAGMYVNRLGLNWEGGIEFMVDDQLAIKRLKFTDLIQDKAGQIEAQDAVEQFDMDFSIMTLELSALINALMAAFGGEQLTDSEADAA